MPLSDASNYSQIWLKQSDADFICLSTVIVIMGLVAVKCLHTFNLCMR